MKNLSLDHSRHEKGIRALAAVLMIAAALKFWALLFSRYPEHYRSNGQSLIILFESTFAGWLWVTNRTRLARLAAKVTFGVFAIYVTTKWLSGEDTCGCFGQLSVHPLWALLLDVICLATLFLWKPEPSVSVDSEAKSNIEFLAPISVILFMGPILWATAGSGRVAVLTPSLWVGDVCPILDQIDTDVNLRTGKYLIVFVRSTCRRCQDLVQEYGKLRNAEPIVILVDVPPYGDTGIGQARLRSNVEWFVETPSEILLENGTVLATSSECRLLYTLTSSM